MHCAVRRARPTAPVARSTHAYSHKTDGYHQLKLSPEFEFGAAFRKYQSDVFTDVALCVQDLPSRLRPPDDEAFRPCAFDIDSV